jgi:transcriptional regulator with XRE-family HTH domain
MDHRLRYWITRCAVQAGSSLMELEGMPKQSRPPRGDSMATPIIAENLSRLLAVARIQGKELADRMQVSPQLVSQWMRGRLVPTKQRLDQIGEILQVEVDEFTRDTTTNTSVPIKRYTIDMSPQTPDDQRLSEHHTWMLPKDLVRNYGWFAPANVVVIQVKDSNMEPTVCVGEELFVDFSWRAVTLSDLYLLDFAGFPHFRWCHLVKRETVNVSDRLMDQDFAAGDLTVLGRVVGRISMGSIRR